MSDAALSVKSVPLDDEQFALAVLNIKTPQQAKDFLDRMIEAKKIVNTLKKFEEYRKHFAILENKAYLQLYERGFHNELREINGSLVAACRWVMSRKGKKKNDIISGEYGPILSAYKHYLKDKNSQEALKSASVWSDSIIDTFNKDGVVTLNATNLRDRVRHSESLSYDMVHDIMDGTKDRLLKAGGYGIGNGKYCKITDEYELRDAIRIRVKSIKDDLMSILTMINDASMNGITVPSLMVDWEAHGNWYLSTDLFVYMWLKYMNNRIKFRFASEKVMGSYIDFVKRLAGEVA